MSEHIEKAPHVPPFVTFVTSAVPMVFDNSLSYYEALCALWKWLQDDVVNVINNNASVTEDYIDLTNEYTQKFIELKEYVDTYFDNLDVQEEINNKLDEMAEDGTLTRLLADYLQTQIIYNTTLEMIADADHLVDGIRVETLGYRSIDDNGASFFVIKDTGTADGKGVIDLENGLYAHMIYKHDFVTPEMFGAYGDGVNNHNDSDAIQYAINTGKTVEFAPKTYTCYSLTVGTPAVLHGNGATLKRPELDIEPYNMTVAEMKWIRTITVNEECTIDNLSFDNNCFTMWQVSDGYAQEQSSSVIVLNNTKQIKFNISDCHFKNSAGDGLHIVQNVIANISHCTSEDCFRGGFVSTGYGSEINLDGWVSKVITTGVNDGFDVEVDSASTINPTLYILNISNVILDYDLDISVPEKGIVNIYNVTMREFDQTTQNGFILGGRLYSSLKVSNSSLISGIMPIQQIYAQGGDIIFENCNFTGNTTNSALRIGQYQPGNLANPAYVAFKNCKIKCYDMLEYTSIKGTIVIDGCNVEATNTCIKGIGATPPMAQKVVIQNSSFKFGNQFAFFVKTQYAIDGLAQIYLFNNRFEGASDGENCIEFAGAPDVFYDSTPFNGAYKLKLAPGSNPKFYGNQRVILVPSSSDLTFRGWVAGNDIAIALDTGTRYQYTSGTTWTAI